MVTLEGRIKNKEVKKRGQGSMQDELHEHSYRCSGLWSDQIIIVPLPQGSWNDKYLQESTKCVHIWMCHGQLIELGGNFANMTTSIANENGIKIHEKSHMCLIRFKQIEAENWTIIEPYYYAGDWNETILTHFYPHCTHQTVTTITFPSPTSPTRKAKYFWHHYLACKVIWKSDHVADMTSNPTFRFCFC